MVHLMRSFKCFFMNLQWTPKTWTEMHKPQVLFNVLAERVYVQLISAQDFTFALWKGFCVRTFCIFCINWKRKVLVESDPNPLCSCIITCFLILWDKIELLSIRESRTYFVSTIRKIASHPKFSCYAIVL